ncbi:uncharacterized protein LOC111704267 isoform X2 [Eurytemora carolleeae]|uniref:uncharacterized protein LOC111704267 isoform X2 n=1 Tax=Eurytemora carolleeae TaxID=1294199 RepID=UPI000C76003C|nr:uncharacterized protein LOC111704267 isoform X2 [Eurytemora carolleeae]|eukprot:XP_023332237.1 uncharacterized protein LOC111704267 isoform X2 [Eurytemora affinis]
MNSPGSILHIILILHALDLQAIQGYGGIRRRAWGKVHMLRSGKRGDVPPISRPLIGSESLEQGIINKQTPHHPGLLQLLYLLRFLEGAETRKKDDTVLSSNISFSPNENMIASKPIRSPNTRGLWGNMHMLRSGRSNPSSIQSIQEKREKSTGPWGNYHMLRSGRSAEFQDGGHMKSGLWGNYHMLRSGRSPPSLQVEDPDKKTGLWGNYHMLRSGRSMTPEDQEENKIGTWGNYHMLRSGRSMSKKDQDRKMGLWGNMHMLRSGRSGQEVDQPAEDLSGLNQNLPTHQVQKRGGLWDYGRPRWGGGHMLRSGRSDHSMLEVERMANNQNNNDRNIE